MTKPFGDSYITGRQISTRSLPHSPVTPVHVRLWTIPTSNHICTKRGRCLRQLYCRCWHCHNYWSRGAVV